MYIKHIYTMYTSLDVPKELMTRKWTGKCIQWVAVWLYAEITRLYIILYTTLSYIQYTVYNNRSLLCLY